MSDCELTETYSPADIDMAPATSPATSCDQDIVPCRSRRGDADDQARGRDDAIVGPEHCGSQPPNAADEVAFRMQAKTAHVLLLITPSRFRTTLIEIRISLDTDARCGDEDIGFVCFRIA